MNAYKTARVFAHYGSAIISAILEANLFFLFGNTIFQQVILCFIALCLEAGKNFVLYKFKHKQSFVENFIAYLLLVSISVIATTNYAIISIEARATTIVGQSVDYERQTIIDFLADIDEQIELTKVKLADVPKSWTNTYKTYTDEIERLTEQKMEWALRLEESPVDTVVISPDYAFKAISGKTGTDSNFAMIVFLIILGITLEYLIYVTEEWESPRTSEAPQAITPDSTEPTIQDYVRALYEIRGDSDKLPTPKRVNKDFGIPLGLGIEFDKELRSRGLIESDGERRISVTKYSLENMLKLLDTDSKSGV